MTSEFNLDKFTDKTRATIAAAMQIAKDYAHAQGMCHSHPQTSNTSNSFAVHPAHIAFALLNESAGEPTSDQSRKSLFNSVIERAGGDPVSSTYPILYCPLTLLSCFQTAVNRGLKKIIVRLPSQQPVPEDVSFGPPAAKVLREAQSLQKTMHDSYVAQDHLILAVLKDSQIATVFKEVGLTEAALKTQIDAIRGDRRIASKNAEEGFDALNKYATDLTALAAEGKIDPVIGRDNEIRRAVRILCRRYALT